ncbi:hypothetical protein ACLGIH_02050 [Streptomyces sp. HMX87]|uniref:hypothetical protein n=1 Tax=Streptomyces sp. HMX87 TaxID=3390849 RepID=UPI003A83ECF9
MPQLGAGQRRSLAWSGPAARTRACRAAAPEAGPPASHSTSRPFPPTWNVTGAEAARPFKVFKLTTRSLAPQERWTGLRRHSFRPLSTRRYHPGLHRVRLQVDGRLYGLADFTLISL